MSRELEILVHDFTKNGPEQIIAFDNHLYVISNNSLLMKSSDAKSWEALTYPSSGATFLTYVDALLVHQSYLYAFIRTDETRLYRTQDGASWDLISLPAEVSDKFVPASLTHQGDIYFYTKEKIYKSEETNGTLSWVQVGRFADIANSESIYGTKLFTFQGIVHLALLTSSSKQHYNDLKIWNLSDGSNWSLKATTEIFGLLGFDRYIDVTEYKENLYIVASSQVMVIKVDQGIYQWAESQSISLNRGRTFDIFGALISIGSTKATQILNQDGEWEEISPLSMVMINGTVLNDVWYGLGARPIDDVWSSVVLEIPKGGLSAHLSQIPQSKISRGSKNSVVFGLDLKINFSDEVSLVVKNFGSAIQNRDILSVQLISSPQNVAGVGATQVLATFTPDLDDNKTWTLTSSGSIEAGEEVFVAVDLSPSAQLGSNIIFGIEPDGFQFKSNPNFKLSSTLVGIPLEIQASIASSALPLDKIGIGPVPAKNNVTFVYNLSETSDIEINIYDREGILISQVKDPQKPTGSKQTTVWNASSYAPGVYYSIMKIKSTSGGEIIQKEKIYIER